MELSLSLSVNKKLQQRFPSDPSHDIQVIHGKNMYEVQKAFLGLECEYFKVLFQQNKNKNIIDLPRRFDSEVVYNILSLTYGHLVKLQNTGKYQLEQYIQFASFLQCEQIMSQLEKFLIANITSFDFEFLLKMQNKYNMQELQNNSINLIRDQFRQEINSANQVQLNQFLRLLHNWKMIDDATFSAIQAGIQKDKNFGKNLLKSFLDDNPQDQSQQMPNQQQQSEFQQSQQIYSNTQSIYSDTLQSQKSLYTQQFEQTQRQLQLTHQMINQSVKSVEQILELSKNKLQTQRLKTEKKISDLSYNINQFQFQNDLYTQNSRQYESQQTGGQGQQYYYLENSQGVPNEMESQVQDKYIQKYGTQQSSDNVSSFHMQVQQSLAVDSKIIKQLNKSNQKNTDFDSEFMESRLLDSNGQPITDSETSTHQQQQQQQKQQEVSQFNRESYQVINSEGQIASCKPFLVVEKNPYQNNEETEQIKFDQIKNQNPTNPEDKFTNFNKMGSSHQKYDEILDEIVPLQQSIPRNDITEDQVGNKDRCSYGSENFEYDKILEFQSRIRSSIKKGQNFNKNKMESTNPNNTKTENRDSTTPLNASFISMVFMNQSSTSQGIQNQHSNILENSCNAGCLCKQCSHFSNKISFDTLPTFKKQKEYIDFFLECSQKYLNLGVFSQLKCKKIFHGQRDGYLRQNLEQKLKSVTNQIQYAVVFITDIQNRVFGAFFSMNNQTDINNFKNSNDKDSFVFSLTNSLSFPIQNPKNAVFFPQESILTIGESDIVIKENCQQQENQCNLVFKDYFSQKDTFPTNFIVEDLEMYAVTVDSLLFTNTGTNHHNI